MRSIKNTAEAFISFEPSYLLPRVKSLLFFLLYPMFHV